MTLRGIDPLWSFLAAGIAIFVVAALLDPNGADDERVIVVDRSVLNGYLASGGGGDATMGMGPGSAPTLASLSDSQIDDLIERYVEEQALYREAKAWGLEDEDPAIRRRLGQSVRFAVRPEIAADPGDAVLRKWFDAHRSDYAEGDRVTFNHVFYDADRNGREGALQRAKASGPPGADWQSAGERYGYQRVFVQARKEQVASQLGEDFATKMFSLRPSPDWQGPFLSSEGAHWVRIENTLSGASPSFERVRAAVLDDWQRDRLRQDLDTRIDALVAGYEARVADDVKAAKDL